MKDETKALREQIKTLSSSLTTLTQEKNKIEASFIAERKYLRVKCVGLILLHFFFLYQEDTVEVS